MPEQTRIPRAKMIKTIIEVWRVMDPSESAVSLVLVAVATVPVEPGAEVVAPAPAGTLGLD